MPTIEPRITFTPTPASGPLLRELAQITGKTPARVVREIVDEMASQMPAMIEALRLIQSRPEMARDALQELTTRVHEDMAQRNLDFNKALRKKPGRNPSREAAKPG